MEPQYIELTLNFNDQDLDPEEREQEAVWLLDELRSIDEVEEIERISDPNPPSGNKTGGGFLVGMLKTTVAATNVKTIFGFLADRLGQKSLEMTVKAVDGRELTVKASSKVEFEFAVKQAQEFLRQS
jgi:ferric-dicitrate binding protein FerR (iron transport regulator)